MSRRTVVLDVVGLSTEHLGSRTPRLSRLARRGATRRLEPVLPAVTCTVQSTFLTGLAPAGHGAVANGWYFRDVAEVALWKQSNHLVAGEKIWDAARGMDPDFTVAKLFWWFNMYSGANWSVTPRPIYWADGLKVPDIYTEPVVLRDELCRALGPFPLFDFWGPNAGIRSSRWIAEAAKLVYDTRRPTLTLVYLPHLDYDLQRWGPHDPRSHRAIEAIDDVCGDLVDHLERDGARVVVVSEYAIRSVREPVHVNRCLRRAGLLRVRDELGREKLDAGASDAFAVADHQVAHVYVRDPARIPEVKHLLEGVDGIDFVLDAAGKEAHGLDHARSGELVAVADGDRWFTYYYWLHDDRAPEFARTVDIHRKPGYDPVELFLDPALRAPKARAAFALAKKKLGFRYLMDVIGLDASIVRGSHGRVPAASDPAPVFLSNEPALVPAGPVRATEVKGLILDHVFATLRPQCDGAVGHLRSASSAVR